MKRFTKMLALGMALALTFGMTVSASENDVVESPGANVEIWGTTATDGVELVDLTGDERAALNAAFTENGVAVAAVGGAYGSVHVDRVNNPFSLKVTKWAKLTLRNVPLPVAGDGYGYVYGYVLAHLTGKKLDQVELIPMTLNADEDGYNVTVSSGSPFQVVRWTLRVHDTAFANVKGANVFANPIYQNEYTAARRALEVDGQGDVVAQNHLSKDYKFVRTIDGVNLVLGADTDVEFPLANINGDEQYVVVCWNNTHDIKGYPDRRFVMSKTSEGVYTAKLPKGSYTAVVMLATNVPGSAPAPADPVPAAPTAPTAPAAGAAGTQAGGAVSPKTGEALPMAVILAAICLAGAAVCAKKARCNG